MGDETDKVLEDLRAELARRLVPVTPEGMRVALAELAADFEHQPPITNPLYFSTEHPLVTVRRWLSDLGLVDAEVEADPSQPGAVLVRLPKINYVRCRFDLDDKK